MKIFLSLQNQNSSKDSIFGPTPLKSGVSIIFKSALHERRLHVVSWCKIGISAPADLFFYNRYFPGINANTSSL